MTDKELEQKIAADEWWQTPEGLAETARMEAEMEAGLEEMARDNAEIDAYLKESGVLRCACGRYKPPYEQACFPCRQQKEKSNDE